MPQYSLSEYTTRIASQIQNGRIEEAIAHARHILSLYPRYLPAYSLLARASMEKGDFSHASHFYQTILSANPEDANAWINLAQLSDDLGEVEQAAWYMERAFELEPGNSRIRERLRQLYSQRDGVERARIKLTPAALARTQTRSGSFRRASQKLQRLLRAKANLPPLHIASLEATLAKALWNQKGKASQADDVCGSLLQKLPRCFQANLIRAQILIGAGQEKEAAPYLDIARQLDPEGEFAFKMLGPQSPLPRTRVEIPYHDYQPTQAEPQEPSPKEPEADSWLDEIGQDDQPPEQVEQEPEAEPRSKAGLGTRPLRAPSIQETSTGLPDAELEGLEQAAETELEVPEWLREIQQEGAQDAETQYDLDWLQEPEQEEPAEPPPGTTPPPLPEDETTDWLDGLRLLQDESDQAETEPISAEEQTMVGQIPDWLLDLSQEPETQQDELEVAEALPTHKEPEPEAPDWLQQFVPDDETTETVPPAVEPSEAMLEPEPTAEGKPALAELGLSDDPDRPAWLKELQAEVTGTPSAAPVTQPLDRQVPATEPPEKPEPSVFEEEEQEAYEWLAELGVPQGPEEEAVLEPTPEEELPDWLLELRDQTGDEVPAAEEPEPVEPEAALRPDLELVEPEPTEPEPTPEPELFEPELEPASILEADLELEDQDLELEEEELEQELPEWLRSLEAEPEPDAEPESIGELDAAQAPDWLSEPTEEPVSTVSVDQMPDWLGRLQEPETEPAGEPGPAQAEPEPMAGVEDLEWLQELESVPEQAAQEPEIEPLAELAEAEALRLEATPAQEPEPARGPESELDLETVLAEAPAEPEIAAPHIEAYVLVDADTVDAATQQYESLLARGDVQPDLVAELEQAVQAHPEHAGLQRVLGDAYMRTNQLQEALEAYREALKKL
jgi:predicted Zn-dependent protease